MTDTYRHHQQQWSEPRAHQVVKAVTAVTAGGSLLVLSGLTLVGTVIALTVATPLLVIFSPVLVPAVITVFLLSAGILTSGGFGLAAATVLTWMYRYVRGDQGEDPVRYNKMGRSKSKGGYGRYDYEHHDAGKGHHATGGVRLTTGARTGLYQS